MKNLIGIVLIVTGFASFGSVDSTIAFAMVFIGGLLLLMGNSRKHSSRGVTAKTQSYYSNITNKTYSSQAEMKRDEDRHLANVYSDPRFR